MAGKSKPHIFVVDDDSMICDAVRVHLESAKFQCSCFNNAEDCLVQLRQRNCDLLITDVHMPEMDGLELLGEVKRIAPWLPVLVMTSYGNIPLAVKAVKAGAMNFVEKPLEWEEVMGFVQSAVTQKDPDVPLKGKSLTRTETTVLRLILQAKSNKEIAHVLQRSVRTIEVHRSHIMNKLDVSSVVELVKRAGSMGLDEST